MSNNEIVYSIINGQPSLVIHADDGESFGQLVEDALDLLGKAEELKDSFLQRPPDMASAAAAVAGQLGATEVAPSNVTPLHGQPVVSTALPNRVNIYPGPDPKNPQYQMLYCEYPYISNQSERERFTHEMKAATQNWWRWSADHKAWLTKTTNDAVVRAKFAENAHLFA